MCGACAVLGRGAVRLQCIITAVRCGAVLVVCGAVRCGAKSLRYGAVAVLNSAVQCGCGAENLHRADLYRTPNSS